MVAHLDTAGQGPGWSSKASPGGRGACQAPRAARRGSVAAETTLGLAAGAQRAAMAREGQETCGAASLPPRRRS